ncbi:ABC transporter ATP-binding protein [Phycicoccus duodecadis]|uniref:Peptide/nickel transport system ATP-binding protein/oligopeptide transport system ATP-binding protein n=1 Tax=Phycicoccus duodecadis TaxID=173053 RepID=A0A2N3YLZ8_9MICO|nr:oligopeptide/dipeptide ABC transporter ATP-binding protein [Phycicoccus duodecadis]PKW27862.1 peptide/nickel transport system ATP-binding protein/oligopeptide transport system ATP-binding protein [Phycicoccus duodecadis]
MPTPDPVLVCDDVSKTFVSGPPGFGRTRVSAVHHVSLSVAPGESVGIVGESGCGKTTLARMLVGLERPDQGTITVAGRDVTSARGRDRQALSRQVQMVFQDPYLSLNPRMTVLDLVGEPLVVHRTHRGATERRERVAELLDAVGLSPDMMSRYPHQFSGGQRQRIGIARAIALEPSVLVCDEPVSALDVSVQAQVVNVLRGLQERLGLAIVFIAHDLGVVRHMTDRTAVMYLGTVVEDAPSAILFDAPTHPYTQTLLAASPRMGRRGERRRRDRVVPVGEPPSPTDPPSGCRFHTRCPLATQVCQDVEPTLGSRGPGHTVACHHADEATGRGAALARVQLG